MKVINENDLNFFRPIECIYKYANKLIFYTVQGDKIYIWDGDTNKCREITDTIEQQTWLFTACIEIEKVLYFVPYMANDMIGYHLETGIIERIAIRNKFTDARYHKAAYYKGKIYLFPTVGNEILIYEIASKQKKIGKIEIAEGQKKEAFILNIYVQDHIVWGITGTDTNIYCYDMEHDQTSVFTLQSSSGCIIDITGGNEELFLLMADGVVSAWNIQKKIERIVWKPAWSGKEPYFAIRSARNMLWLIPQSDNCVKAIDYNGEIVKEWDFSYLRQKYGFLFESVVQQGDIFMITPFRRGELVIIDAQKCAVEVSDIHLNLTQQLKVLISNSNKDLVSKKTIIGAHIWEELKDR